MTDSYIIGSYGMIRAVSCRLQAPSDIDDCRPQVFNLWEKKKKKPETYGIVV